MSNIPTDLRYANSHEWARANSDGTITIGISDHAQQQLGDLVYVEVPEQGRTVAAAESSATIESVKAASEIYSPVAGEIVEINEQLADAPELVNNDPYGEGWLFKVKSDDDLNSLMDAESYQQLTASDE